MSVPPPNVATVGADWAADPLVGVAANAVPALPNTTRPAIGRAAIRERRDMVFSFIRCVGPMWLGQSLTDGLGSRADPGPGER
jgi:hypothetical protein